MESKIYKKADFLFVLNTFRKMNKNIYINIKDEKIQIANDKIYYDELNDNIIKFNKAITNSDIEYAYSKTKASKEKGVVLSVEDDMFLIKSPSGDSIFATFTDENSLEITKDQNPIFTHTENVNLISDAFKYIYQSIDQKGYSMVPFMYLELSEKTQRIFTVHAWEVVAFNFKGTYTGEKKMFKVKPEGVFEAIKNIPSSKTKDANINFFDNKIVIEVGGLHFSFDIELDEKLVMTIDSFIDTIGEITTELSLEAEMGYKIINKLQSIGSDDKGAFLQIMFDERLDKLNMLYGENIIVKKDGFIREKTKLPGKVLKGDDVVVVYGKYIKEFLSKISSENAIIKTNGNVILLEDEDNRYFSLSMSRRAIDTAHFEAEKGEEDEE